MKLTPPGLKEARRRIGKDFGGCSSSGRGLEAAVVINLSLGMFNRPSGGRLHTLYIRRPWARTG